MDNTGYIATSRQVSLAREMQIIANNIANLSTVGFKSEQLLFSEYIKGSGPKTASISMGHAHARRVIQTQGSNQLTNGTFDLAIEGTGYFLVQGEQGEQLTRAGQFTVDQTGRLVTPDGRAVLDQGGSEILLPPEAAAIAIARDGTISDNGQPIGQVAVVEPINPSGLRRVGDTRFEAPDGWEEHAAPNVQQGFLEDSNVNAMTQMARMIEVQRAYQLGQSLIDNEHDRIEKTVDTLGKK